MRSPSALLLALTLAACSGAPDRGAAAEQSGFGYAERGRLASGDAQYGDRYVDGYSVSVATVRPLALTLDSGAFDAVMVLVDPSGTARAVTDCEGTADACIRVEEPARGVWNVRVTSAAPGASGGYTFAVARPLTGIVAPEPLASRSEPLLPLRPATAPEAPPRADPAPRPTPEAPAPEPAPPAAPAPEASGAIGEPTVDQSLSGTFTGAGTQYRLDGRDRPAVELPLVLLEGDRVSLRFASDAFEPFAVLSRGGRAVETARASAGSDPSASIQYAVPETGAYTLTLGTTDADLVGAFEFSLSFVRSQERIRNAPRVDTLRRPDGRPYSQADAMGEYLGALPSLGAVRGDRLGQRSGLTRYETTLPFPTSAGTEIACGGGVCAITALVPTRDVNAAVETAALLVRRFNEASGYAFDDNLGDTTDPDNPNVTEYRFTSPDAVVTISYDKGRYDPVLGVPVVLAFAGR